MGMRIVSRIFFGCMLFGVIYGVPQFGGRPVQPPPGSFPPIPPEIRQLLPIDAVTKLEAIHNDPYLTFLQKQEKIDQVMTSLPHAILDKIPPPPGFYNLPADVQQKLKDIQRSKDLTFEQKQKQSQEIIQSLPEKLRRTLVHIPLGGPPPPNRAHRGSY